MPRDLIRGLFVVVALASTVPASALAVDLPASFDLLCDTHGGAGPLPRPVHFQIDLVSRSWCINDCAASHGGARVVDKDLILEVKNRGFDTGYKTTEIQTINTDTLNYFGVSEAQQGGQFLRRQVIVGTCRLAPFSPVTGPQTPW